MESPQNDGNVASYSFGFTGETMRKNFLRKVYSILMCQLLITLVCVVVATFHQPTKNYIEAHPVLGLIAMFVTFGILIVLACCDDLRRNSPTNYILLFVFTVAESFLISVTVTRFYPYEILLAIGLTALICFALAVFAVQTKFDFTIVGGFLLVAVLVLLAGSIVSVYFPGKTITLVISCAGVLLFSLYFIYDIQLMISGDHKYSISPEEYILATLNVYVDIINIFVHVLRIIGVKQ